MAYEVSYNDTFQTTYLSTVIVHVIIDCGVVG